MGVRSEKSAGAVCRSLERFPFEGSGLQFCFFQTPIRASGFNRSERQFDLFVSVKRNVDAVQSKGRAPASELMLACEHASRSKGLVMLRIFENTSTVDVTSKASRCATIQGRSSPLGRVRVSAQGANWLCWKSRRSWLCCAPNFVAGLFFGLNLVEDHPNVKDRMGRDRASVPASIRSVWYAFILYKLEHHPAWTSPPHIVPQVRLASHPKIY